MTALKELDEAINMVFELAEEREDLELLERLSDLEDAYRKLESEKAAAWDEGVEALATARAPWEGITNPYREGTNQ